MFTETAQVSCSSDTAVSMCVVAGGGGGGGGGGGVRERRSMFLKPQIKFI